MREEIVNELGKEITRKRMHRIRFFMLLSICKSRLFGIQI